MYSKDSPECPPLARIGAKISNQATNRSSYIPGLALSLSIQRVDHKLPILESGVRITLFKVQINA